MITTMLEWALRYAEKLKVFPLHGIVDGRCTCGKDRGQAGKIPIHKAGFHGATDDALQIKQWWSRHPNANIGIPMGNGLFVIDIDGEPLRVSKQLNH